VYITKTSVTKLIDQGVVPVLQLISPRCARPSVSQSRHPIGNGCRGNPLPACACRQEVTVTRIIECSLLVGAAGGENVESPAS
jgi:hypothetical protein